ALFAGIEMRVAAHRHGHHRARAAACRAGPASVDLRAIRCTAAGASRRAVVARLVAFDDAVAADDGRGAWLARGGAHEVRLGLARPRAAVAGDRVSVVALLGRLDDAVAAIHEVDARRADGRAREAGLDLAARAAAVAARRVEVVALLAGIE